MKECNRYEDCLDCQGERPDDGTYCKVYQDLEPEPEDVFNVFYDVLSDAEKDDINIEVITDTDTLRKIKQELDYYVDLAARFAELYADVEENLSSNQSNIEEGEM